MKEIIYNYDFLTKEELTKKIVRVKALIINSKKEVLLGYAHKTYQFPGGHLEDSEDYLVGLKREIKEETGININTENLKPFMSIKHYVKNYNDTEDNCSVEIYYYLINTDEKYHLDNTNYDDWELLGGYELKYIPIGNVEKLLHDTVEDNRANRAISEEMIEVLREYSKITTKEKQSVI
ncbi:MAG: NUDIX hydrolase [Bacilli bacterium]|nr:NUDIX hydrolase [Bacilli bacterium]